MGNLRIRAGVWTVKDGMIKKRNNDGTFEPTEKFLDKMNEDEERFREPIIIQINEQIGDNWAVRFTPYTEELFNVQVYCVDDLAFNKIVTIILDKLDKTQFHRFYHHPASDIENLW